MFIETAEELKEQLNVQQFRMNLEELEMDTKTLYEVNEKIMSAINAEHIEEEIVTTRKESFKLKLTLMGLRDFQHEFDAKDSKVDQNSQTETGYRWSFWGADKSWCNSRIAEQLSWSRP